jgi:AsmA protein
VPKFLKLIFVSIGLLALLILVGIGLSSWLISPNDFKPQIIEAVKKQTGRDLTIDGDLQLSWFPWLAVTADKITINNIPGFEGQPFAKLAQVNAGLKLLSLLSKKIEINQVTIKDLDLRLITNAQGMSNWTDLLAKQTTNSQSNQTPTTASTPTTFTIGSINVENAHVLWDDQKTGKQFDIQTLNLKTGQFAFNNPVSTDLAFVLVNKNQLAKSVKLTGNLSVNEQFDVISLTKPIVNIDVAGEHFPNKTLAIALLANTVEFNQQQQAIKLSGLQINAADMQASSDLAINNLNQNPTVNGTVNIPTFNPSNALKTFGLAVPELQDKQVLNSLAVNASLQANQDGLDLQNMTVKLDDSTMTGNFNLKNFAQSAVQFKLVVDQINADRYLTAETKQTANSLASPAATLAAAASLVPIKTLRKLDANGEIELKKLTVNNLTMQGIHLTVEAKNGSVKTSQSAKQFYQGDYSGSMDVNVSAAQPVMAVTEKINHVQLQPMLQDMHFDAKITGLIDATSQLNTQGNTGKELKSALNGSLRFLIKDSVVGGFNLQNLIDNGKNLLQNKQLPPANKNEQTLFSTLSGTATIDKGVIQNNDLIGTAAKLQLTGKGHADLNTQQLDYKLNAKFTDAAGANQVPALAINVTGPFSQPNYQLDVAALIIDKKTVKVLENVVDHNKDKIDKLLNKLDKKTGQKALDLLKKIF